MVFSTLLTDFCRNNCLRRKSWCYE